MLALLLAGPSYVPTLSGRPVAVRRDSAISMQLNSKFVNFDQDGVFEGRSSAAKPPLKLLTRLEDLGLLSSLGEAGVLSAAEEAGLFSKLESAGAYSSIEKLLPLADKLNVFGTVEGLINVDSTTLVLLATVLLAGEVGLITVVPDDNTALIAVQALTGVAAGAAAVTLLRASYLFSLLQSK